MNVARELASRWRAAPRGLRARVVLSLVGVVCNVATIAACVASKFGAVPARPVVACFAVGVAATWLERLLREDPP